MNNQQETPKYTFEMVWQMFAELKKEADELRKQIEKKFLNKSKSNPKL